jgi:hypothetical protein
LPLQLPGRRHAVSRWRRCQLRVTGSRGRDRVCVAAKFRDVPTPTFQDGSPSPFGAPRPRQPNVRLGRGVACSRATACRRQRAGYSTSTSRDSWEARCGAGLRHRNRSAPSSSGPRTTTRPRGTGRWTPGAPPICPIRSHSMTCWTPLGTPWLSRQPLRTRGHVRRGSIATGSSQRDCPAADHRHGRRIPVDRPVQLDLQGRYRHDAERIPAPDPGAIGIRCTRPRRESRSRSVWLRIRLAEFCRQASAAARHPVIWPAIPRCHGTASRIFVLSKAQESHDAP